ncbi:MAG: 50S ribosomal protein L31e [Nitrososphaerales archaeon]
MSKKQEEKLERIYTVPLTQAWITARHKRTKRAVKVLREFAEHHMKSSEIKITTELNERLWNRGITKPPRKITVKMVKDEDGLITISLPKVEKTEPSDEEKGGQVALPKMKQKELAETKEEALPEAKQEALPAATEEKKEEPAAAETKAKVPAKKKAPAKKKTDGSK